MFHRLMFPMALVLLLLAPVLAFALDYPDKICADCHSQTGGEPTEVDHTHLGGSAHEDLSCTECHSDINQLPHQNDLIHVDCSICHDDVAAEYVQHGRAFVGDNDHVPSCKQCHGTHQILPADDVASMVHPSNLPNTCAGCHENQQFIKENNIKFKHPIEVYQKGVHGQATAGGKDMAASCNDCHSTGGNAHKILPPGNLESTINYFNISKTCGTCHSTIQKEYEKGIHGELVARGEVDAPTCTQCHGEHGILATDDPRSPVSPFRVAEVTCTPCHESAKLNEKYDLPSGRLQSYVDSYHGLKSRAGDKTVANCSSCHMAHLVLASDDPQSSVYPGNLVDTCGHCHPGMSVEKASETKIHSVAGSVHSGWAYWVKIIYQILIFCVIGGMAGYCLLDYLRQIRNMMRKEQVRRMEADEVVQHTVLAISFSVLVVTGFSLRYYDAWWANLLFGREGGAAVRGLIHRGAAIVMTLGAIWHLLYLFTLKGRIFFKDMSLSFLDAKQFYGMMLYNLGRSDRHPQMRRFSFVEKAEYWALIWGTIVMFVTGVAMWFESYLVMYLGKGVLEVFLVIHYYEAWLAFLAILVWHMYGVIFNPHLYPMNPSWLTGTMPKEMFEVEHPAAQSVGNVDKVKRLGLEREV
jgi:cytochrome b subunit of formate dehydrogenase